MCTRRGLARSEILALAVAATAVTSLLLPVLGGARSVSIRDMSAANLRIIHQGLSCYAAEWNNRQWTAVPDDLGAYGGDCDAFSANRYALDLLLGWGPNFGDSCTWFDDDPNPEVYFYGYYFCQETVLYPLDYDSSFGSFRMINSWPLHDYMAADGLGRYYDEVFYAPADEPVYSEAAPYFDEPCEYITSATTGTDGFSSYVLSPAAMYDPAVFGADGGAYTDPDTFDEGYRSPPVGAVRYADLKTWVIEHHWLYNPPAPCQPADMGAPCQPYRFNGGADAAPLVTFYDGSLRPLRSGTVAADDARVMRQTGVGLWRRDTPLGAEGYFGSESFDGTVVSHHILTSEGILGRDRLAPKGGRP